MADPHRAFRQLQRMLNIDDQGRSYRQGSSGPIDTTGCKVLGTMVYDLKNPDPTKRVRYEPRESGQTKPDKKTAP